ncbi:MAG: hypothetical protein AAF990_26620 [Bacteroidota bacterium]
MKKILHTLNNNSHLATEQSSPKISAAKPLACLQAFLHNLSFPSWLSKTSTQFSLPIIYTSLLCVILASNGQAQDAKPKFSLKGGGFIWTETIFDTRQTVSARDGDVILYPAKKFLDANGEDINDSPDFTMANIHSRALVKVTAPSFLNAKVSGLLEMDFVGSSNDKIGLLRLRHAMVKLNWEKSELLFGQYWHPMFATESFPQVVSWGGAIPFHPLSRNAQIRYSQVVGKHSQLSFSICTQLDFKSPGPSGPSSKYLRDSGIPEVNASYIFGKNKNVLFGINVGYKVLKPSLFYEMGGENYKCTETIGSYQMNAFSRIKMKKTTLRAGMIYGQNLYNFLMLGGYGIKGLKDNGEPTFTNLTAGSYWLDFDSGTLKEKFSLGIYAGYTKNYGAQDEITGAVYARGTDIDHAYRVAPRIIYGTGRVRFRVETIYNVAAYGTPNAKYQVENTERVTNFRFLFATTLVF